VEILTAAKVHCIPDVGVRMLDHDKIREKVNVMNVAVEPMLIPEYWDRDGLSVLPPQRCSKCRQCSFKGECSEKHLIHSLEEEEDLRASEDNIEVVTGVTIVKYPFKKDPSCLPFNRSTAVSIADKSWRSLEKDGLLDAYNSEIKKYID